MPALSPKVHFLMLILDIILLDFIYEKWGRLDLNQRTPKRRDLQSVEIQSLTTYFNSYQPKIQYLMFKYLLLMIEKNCLFLVITVPPVSHNL